MINILDWFDITNKLHLQAYQYIKDSGNWPEGFLPENMYFPISWENSLNVMMAEEYTKLIHKETHTHTHRWETSLDGGTFVCECGAWK